MGPKLQMKKQFLILEKDRLKVASKVKSKKSKKYRDSGLKNRENAIGTTEGSKG
jgi:hypothetical protein